MQLLRRMKAEAALLIALCDIGGVWPVMRVTAALTDLAVASVQAALALPAAAGGRARPAVAARSRPAGGWLRPDRARDGQDGRGRAELFQRHRPDRVLRSRRDRRWPPDIEPQPFFVRVTQALARLLQQRTGDGYVFRVDLRLRPDPASTQVAMSTEAALHYYEREGRTWERAAMIKARPCAGDRQGGRGADRGDRAVRLAQASRFRRACRRPRHEAADADLSRPKRDRGRRPQRQGRPRRHPRDRVFRPDPAIDRRRPASGIAGAADAARRCNVLASSNWITFEARDELTAAYRVPAAGRAPAADDRRRADPCAARRGRGGRALCALLRL